MYANGFFETKRRNPAGLATVIVLHAAALGAVIMFGTTTFVTNKAPVTNIFDVEPLPPPPVEPPPPPQDRQQPRSRSNLDAAPPELPRPDTGPVVPPGPVDPPTRAPVGERLAEARPVLPPIPPPPPVFRAAQVDPRFARELQPPYPPSMERAQRDGQVRVRITIGTDGRVTAIDQVSATDNAFWIATQRQALRRWRFRPATEDGRPVVSTMAFTITFRIPDA